MGAWILTKAACETAPDDVVPQLAIQVSSHELFQVIIQPCPGCHSPIPTPEKSIAVIDGTCIR